MCVKICTTKALYGVIVSALVTVDEKSYFFCPAFIQICRVKGYAMNIYKYAMKMELDGEMFYRNLADKAESEGIRNILTMLADEEAKHFETLKRMNENVLDVDMASTDSLQNVRNIFADIQENNIDTGTDAEQIDLYRKAQEHEEKSYQFYLEKSEEAEKESEKAIFLKLANEEKKHMILMGNIADFVGQPDLWVADAEFNHMDDY
jgi:rubrerythrin